MADAINLFRRAPIGGFMGVIGGRKGLNNQVRFVGGKSAQVRNPAIVKVTATPMACEGGKSYTLPKDPTTWDGDYNRGGLIKPLPTLKSVTIDYGGDWGLAQRINVEIEAYTKDDFQDIFESFLIPGNKLRLDLAYSFGGNVWDVNDSVSLKDFTIATFEFNANSEGTWLCRCSAVSSAVALKTADMQMMMVANGLEYIVAGEHAAQQRDKVSGVDQLIVCDTQQNGTMSLNSIVDGTVRTAGDFSDYVPNVDGFNFSKAALVMYDGKYLRNVFQNIGAWVSRGIGTFMGTYDEATQDTYQIYVTLGYVVHRIINDQLMRQFHKAVHDTEFMQLKIKFHKDYSKGVVPRAFKSGDPLSVLLMGNSAGDYKNSAGKGKDFENDATNLEAVRAISGDGIVDLGKILIHKDVVSGCLAKASKKREAAADNADVKDTKEEVVNIVDFFNAISDAINVATGGFIAIRLVEDMGGDDKKVLWVVDQNYGISNKLPCLKLDPINSDNVTRSCDIQSNVGSEEYRVAMFAGASKKGDAISAIRGCLPSVNTKRIKAQYEAAKKMYELVKDPGLLGENNFGSSQVQGLVSAVSSYYKAREDARKYEPVHYPGLSIHATINGAWGIIPGCAVTSTQVPESWYSKNVYFMVRRVTHTITNSDWSTDIEGILATNSEGLSLY